MKVFLDNKWKFCDSFEQEQIEEKYEDRNWQDVNLPHTCKELPFHYFDDKEYQMICCYRRWIDVPEDWSDKRLLLTFDGVGHVAYVYINGQLAGKHENGYTAFTFDITSLIRMKERNLITVKVDTRESLNVPPFGNVVDYLTYGGIYRDVYLEVRNQNYIEDIFAKYELSDEEMPSARVELDIAMHADMERDFQLMYSVKLNGDSQEIISKGLTSFEVMNVKRWTLEDPVLYEITATIWKNGETIDEKTIQIGFRTAEFMADGFYLNGKKTKLIGMNRHQSYPYVGYAMPKSMQRLDADILKMELGVNAVRTSHYPQSSYFYDRCDELGILVFTEIPGWQYIGDQEWKAVSLKTEEEMIRQNRNHPSIILWGVRINESVDDDEFYRQTNTLAHKLDPTRATGGVRFLEKSHLLEDVYTFNDFSHIGTNPGVQKKSNVTSDIGKAYLISEYNGHMFPTKTVDCEDRLVEHAIRHANVLNGVFGEKDIAGSFAWCMFDYNTHKDFGSGDRICYHGVLDMFRNSKMAASVYASQSENRTVFEISSAMDIGEHPACAIGTVYAFTNADYIKLYKNGEFIRDFYPESSNYQNMPHPPIAMNDFVGDQLIKKEGFNRKKSEQCKEVLWAIGKYGQKALPLRYKLMMAKLILLDHLTIEEGYRLYNEYVGSWGDKVREYRFDAIKGNEVVSSITKVPATRAILKAEASCQTLVEEETYDVALIRIRMEDEHHNLLHFANEPVLLEASGTIKLIGPSSISLQGGLGGTYVKTCGKEGAGHLDILMNGQQVRLEFLVLKQREE